MHTWQPLLRRILRALVVTLLISALPPLIAPATAQDDDPDALIETLALNVHRQNLRLHSYTGWIGGALGQPENAPRRTALADRLDNWTLTGFAGDADVDLAERERPVLLNFWASWCPPCQAEFPHLSRVALAPDDHAFDVIFVNMSDTERDAREFLSDYPQELTTTIDLNDRLSLRASVESIPTNLLVDTDGTVLIVHVGAMTPTVTAFFDAVATHPGAGTFIGANHMDESTTAILAPVALDDAAPLIPGETAEGSLDDEQFQQVYRFEGRAGDEVTITMEADDGDLDPYLVLMTASGARLEEKDDIQEGVITDSEVNVILPEDGTYIVVATRFLEAEGFSSGRYTLTLALSAAAPVVAAPAGDTPLVDAAADAAADPTTSSDSAWTQREGDGFVRYNSTVAGEVSGINPRALFAFEARAGDVVTLSVTHDPAGAPLVIEVRGPDQSVVAESTPSERGSVSLSNITVPDAGYYRVTVTRERSREQDWMPFDLTIELGGDAPPTDATAQQQDQFALVYGQSGTASISDTEYQQRWTFEGTVDDVITVEMTRTIDEDGGLDGYLILEGPDGSALLEVDDAHNTVMPAIDGYTLPESGSYTIVATRFGFASGFSTGEYTLTLRASDAPSETGSARPDWLVNNTLPADLRLINYNESQFGTIDDDNIDDWYTFQGSEGDELTVTLDADDSALDPFLVLTTTSGIELASNDDVTTTSTNAGITDFVLPATDTYLIRASRYGFANGPSHGAYQISIATESAPVSAAATVLSYGDTASGDLDFDRPIDRFSFTGRAGEQVTIRVAGSQNLLPALILRGPAGDTVASDSNDAGSAEAVLLRVPLPVDGDYTVEVVPKDLNTAGAYHLLLLGRDMPDIDPGAFEPAPDSDLEVVLIWSSGVDLDLNYTAPENASDVPRSAANDFCQDLTTAPVERLAWPADTAIAGHYAITITYRHNCTGQQEPVMFILAEARDGDVIDLIGGTLAREGDHYTTHISVDR